MTAKKHLTQLLTAVVKESDVPDTNPFSGFMSGVIPQRLRTKEMRESKQWSLVLSGSERDMFDAALTSLRNERAAEYLSDKELKDKLWDFVCEVFLNRRDYKKQSNAKAKVEAFISDLLKPVEDYEVMFKILNFDAGAERIDLWDCEIKRYSGKELKDWGLGTSVYYRTTLKDFKNETLICIKERGNNPTLVLERARNQAGQILTAMRIYLSEQEFIPDEQLLFELSEQAAVKNLGKSKVVLQGWKRGRKAIPLTFHDSLNQDLEEANRQYELIGKLPKKLRGRAERSIYWIGRSIVEPYPDLKVSALCTAMETLLTSISDKRKGEAIAYRMVLLDAVQDNGIRHPGNVLWIYTVRSNVVHGSTLNEATKTEYHTMLGYARRTLKNYLDLMTQKNLKKQTELFTVLEASSHAQTLVDWLKGFTDEHSKAILSALQNAIGKDESN